MKWNNKKYKKLVEAILALNTNSQTRNFLRDLMTEKEIKEFANRLQAAQMELAEALHCGLLGLDNIDDN